MKEKEVPTKLMSVNGKFFRATLIELSEDETGLNAVIIFKLIGTAQMIHGVILCVTDDTVIVKVNDNDSLILDKEWIVAWSSARLYHKDINDPDFQTNAPKICKNFNEKGIII